MKRIYKAGIIGLGNIGFRYALDPLRKWVSTHLQAYSLHPDFEPIAGCDINHDRLKEAKAYYPKLKLYTSWEKMLSKEHLDILSVCVSPEMNYDISASTELSKLKAVIFEKPLSKNLETGIEIVNNLKKTEVVAAVNYFRRWQGTFLKLKDLINSKVIGDIQKVNGRYATGLFNAGVHLIDTVQYLLGAFTEIRALKKIRHFNGTDVAYSFYGKIKDIGVFVAGFDKSFYNIFEMEIWGNKGKLCVDNFGTRIGLQEVLSSERFSLQKELKEVREFKTDGLGSNFTNLLENLACALRKKDKSQILCTPEDALQTIKVAEEIVTSYNLGGSLINLKRG